MGIDFMAVEIITPVVGSFFDIILVPERWFEFVADGMAVVTGSLSMAHITETLILAGLLPVVVHEINGVIKAAEGE